MERSDIGLLQGENILSSTWINFKYITLNTLWHESHNFITFVTSFPTSDSDTHSYTNAYHHGNSDAHSNPYSCNDDSTWKH